MEAQTQSQNVRRPDKIIRFSSRDANRYGVTQSDLAEERLFTIEAAVALKKLGLKRKRIRRAVESGGAVEPGLRSAELVLVKPKPYSAKPKPYTKLVIK